VEILPGTRGIPPQLGTTGLANLTPLLLYIIIKRCYGCSN